MLAKSFCQSSGSRKYCIEVFISHSSSLTTEHGCVMMMMKKVCFFRIGPLLLSLSLSLVFSHHLLKA